MLDRLVGRLLARLLASPWRVLLIAGLVGLGAVGLASRLELRTALFELLPSRDPAVTTLARTQERVGDMNLLLVGIRSPDRAANLRYAEALTQYLRTLPADLVEIATYHLHDLEAFFQQNRWLYLSEPELEEIRDRLRKELVTHKNPFAIDLDSDEPSSAKDAPGDTLRTAVQSHRSPIEERFPDGTFVRDDYAWVAILPPGGIVTPNAGQKLVAAVRGFIAAHSPAQFHPGMTVQPAGPVMSGIQNREAVEHDIVSVTVLCAVLIGLSIALYFRSLLWVVLVVAPAGLGTALAFAGAELAFGYLNSSTAFLGSIILGNGINHGIVLGSRYREARNGGAAPAPALKEAVHGVLRGTLAASLAAAVAYASLMLTSFRGFSQFGLMGALGCLACWGATFLVMPPLVLLFDRRAPKAHRRLFRDGPLVALVGRHPKLLVTGSLLLTVVAAFGLRHFAGAPFEYDFRRLGTDVEHDTTYRQFDHNMDSLFGLWHSPTVLLADRLDQVEPMRRAIRRQDRKDHPYIGRVVDVYDLLPGPPDVQQRKVALLAQIRRLGTDPAVDLLDERDRRLVKENLPAAGLRLLVPDDLPPVARRPFTERDGTVGRVLLTYHNSPSVSMWRGQDLLGIASVLSRLTLEDGTVIESSGPPMVFGAMLRSILHDGPIATGLSLAGVIIMALLFLPSWRAALAAIAALLIGVFWMVGSAGLFSVRITFLNFIALPITFGVGIEYAANLVTRLREERAPAAAVGSTGRAVALCSWTTIVGYGSLLAASSRALRGFGALAILGEIACLAGALLALPALVALWRERHADDWPPREAPQPPASPSGSGELRRPSSHGPPLALR